jgi:FAS-associated factor 2
MDPGSRGDEGSVDQLADHEQKITNLISITQCNSDMARFCLESSGWELETALQLFYEISLPPQTPATQRRFPSTSQNSSGNRGGFLRSLASRLLKLPFVAINAGLGIAFASLALGLGLLGMAGSYVLPSSVSATIKGALSQLSSPPRDLDSNTQGRKFVEAFEAAYGNSHPHFVQGSFKQAIAQAKNDFKFAFVYFHSPEHQDTKHFCAEVLIAPDLVSYINEHFISWGGNVQFSDAFLLARRVDVTTYPCVALLNTNPSNQVRSSDSFWKIFTSMLISISIHIALSINLRSS